MAGENISSVFQDFIKYPLTVYDNIALGNINNYNNRKQVEEAAIETGANFFIDNFKEKYSTQLMKEWDQGCELSLGEWQKIANARCFFRDSSVLILDEPFSSIDPLSEKKILDNLRIKKKNKICIFVTHQYTSICLADEIIVMKKGEIIENGSHTYLMSLHGDYFELFNAQADPIHNMET